MLGNVEAEEGELASIDGYGSEYIGVILSRTKIFLKKPFSPFPHMLFPLTFFL